MTEDQKREALLRLEANPDFQLWRTEVAEPVLAQIEAQLQQPLELDEVKLKSLLCYRNLVQGIFTTVFGQLRYLHQQALQEQEKNNGER